MSFVIISIFGDSEDETSEDMVVVVPTSEPSEKKEPPVKEVRKQVTLIDGTIVEI